AAAHPLRRHRPRPRREPVGHRPARARARGGELGRQRPLNRPTANGSTTGGERVTESAAGDGGSVAPPTVVVVSIPVGLGGSVRSAVNLLTYLDGAARRVV